MPSDCHGNEGARSLELALVALLADRPIADLTVAALLHRAGYPRSTFYARFHGLDGYLTHVLDEEVCRFVQTLTSVLNPRPGQSRDEYCRAACLPLYQHIADRKDLYRLILTDAMRDGTRDYLCDHICARLLARVYVHADPRLDVELAARARVTECLATVQWWQENDFARSAQFMAEQVGYLYAERILFVARRNGPEVGAEDRPLRTGVR